MRDEVARAIQTFKVRQDLSVLSKLDLLLDLEHLTDPRIVPFLVEVLQDVDETVEVRARVIRQLRVACCTSQERASGARALRQVLDEPSSSDLRLAAVVALADFTQVPGIASALGRVALNPAEASDTRYSALTALERAGPIAEVTALVRQMLEDELLGQLAHSVLRRWQLS